MIVRVWIGMHKNHLKDRFWSEENELLCEQNKQKENRFDHSEWINIFYDKPPQV